MGMSGAHDTSRIGAFDGLRGWAALSVVLSHCLYETFKYRFPEMVNFPTAFIANGTFAVGVFFAISGYVLTIRRWHSPNNPPLYIAFARRYLRLTLPIIAATFIAWALIALGATPMKGTGDVAQVTSWYKAFVGFEADFFRAWFFALFGTYGFLWDNNYNPFLWTMMIELWGALIIYAISQHERYLRDPYMPLLFCIVLVNLIFPIAACFFVGALIALAERDGFALKPSVMLNRIATVLLLVCLSLAAVVLLNGKSLQWLAILGVGVFISVRYSETAQRFLTTPVSRFMGRISFPLYLVQFAVMVSFSGQLILWANNSGQLNVWTAYGIAAASTAMCLLVATLFLPVETGTLALLRRIDRYRASRTPVLGAKAQA
jgi:peptidoglycan/LPS O-acetylase OafA/YrhL